MTGRGLGSMVTAPPRTLTRGSRLQPRLEGLASAVAAARGHLPDDLLDEVQASVARSTARLQLSAAHTVVAIAGSTGSGKSTLFNALAGADVSMSGAQRPTTSTAKALTWSDDRGDGSEEILAWLGIPGSDRHRRTDLAKSPRRSRLPEGLILLDLPDHDSIERAHHEEAQRMIELADLLIWVVDPQKYADAAIHRTYLQPLAGHRAVTMVVLNHIETVPEERRDGMLRDLRKLLVADGIRDPRTLATSARHGSGVDELRTAIRRRVEEKQNAALRVEADVRAAADRLLQASGDAPPAIPEPWVCDLERSIAQAAGVPAAVRHAARDAHAEVARLTAWPVRRVRSEPQPSDETRPPTLRPVNRHAVDSAIRGLVEQVGRDLSPAWAGPLRAATIERLETTDDRIDAELAALRFQPELPRWLPVLRPVRAFAVVCAVAAAALTAGAVTGRVPVAAAAVVLALAAVVGAVALVAGSAAKRAEADQADVVADECQRVIARAVRGHVLGPVRTELAAYSRFRRDLDVART